MSTGRFHISRVRLFARSGDDLTELAPPLAISDGDALGPMVVVCEVSGPDAVSVGAAVQLLRGAAVLTQAVGRCRASAGDAAPPIWLELPAAEIEAPASCELRVYAENDAGEPAEYRCPIDIERR